MQKVREQEILQMQAEFIRDECDNIWFVYASKIHYRKYRKPQALDFYNDPIGEAQALQHMK